MLLDSFVEVWKSVLFLYDTHSSILSPLHSSVAICYNCPTLGINI